MRLPFLLLQGEGKWPGGRCNGKSLVLPVAEMSTLSCHTHLHKRKQQTRLRESRGKTWQEPSVFLPHQVTGGLGVQPYEECQKALEFMDFPELCGSRPHYVYSGKIPARSVRE